MAASGWQFFFMLLGIAAVLICGPTLILYLFLPRKPQDSIGSKAGGDAPG